MISIFSLISPFTNEKSVTDSIPPQKPFNPLINPYQTSHFPSTLQCFLDYKQQKFIANIPLENDKNLYSFSIEIFDFEEFKVKNHQNSRQMIPKFDFLFQGIAPNFLQIDDISLKKCEFSDENHKVFLISKANSPEKLYELFFVKFSKDSLILNNLFFLLCIQKEEKLACFTIIEQCFLQKNKFRLPFMEPNEYFIVLFERKEKIILLYLLEIDKLDVLAVILQELSQIIAEFLKRNFLFLAINFQHFAYFINEKKIKLINPSNIMLFHKDFKGVSDYLKENKKEIWDNFILFYKNGIENVLDLYKYAYFSLVFSYYHYQAKFSYKTEGFSEYFSKSLQNIDNLLEIKPIFLLLNADSIEKIKEFTDNSHENSQLIYQKNPEIFKKNSQFSLFFPKDLPKTLKLSEETDQFYLKSQLQYLNFLVIFDKFEESFLLIKKLRSQTSDILTTTFLIEKTAYIYLNTEKIDKGIDILNQGLTEISQIYGTNSNEISAKLYFLQSLFHISKNRFAEAIKVLELAYSLSKSSQKTRLFFDITFTLGHLYKETNKIDRSFSCFCKIKVFLWENFSSESLIRKIYCEIVGMLYIQRHEYNSARELLEIALEINEIRFENIAKNEKYSNILNSLGMCYFELRNPKKALLFYEKSIEIKGNLFSQNYENKAETLNNLALIYAELGDNKKAIEMNLKAIEIYTQNKDRISLANSLNNLGLSYKSSLEFDKSIESMSKALCLFEEEFGKTHLQIGKTLNNIGMTYYDKGDKKQAIEYCEKALEIYNQFPNENPQGIGRALNNLGILYSGNKDYEKALEYYQKALEIKRKAGNKNNIDIADTLNNQATVYYMLKKMDLAIENYKIVLEIRQKNMGDQHKNTVESLLNMGNCYFETGEFKESGKFLKKVMDLKIKADDSFEKSHECAIILDKIAVCEGRIENYDASLELFKKAILIERNLAEVSKNLGFFLRNYGFFLSKLHKYKESSEILKESLIILKKFFKKTEPEIISLKKELKNVKLLLKT